MWETVEQRTLKARLLSWPTIMFLRPMLRIPRISEDEKYSENSIVKNSSSANGSLTRVTILGAIFVIAVKYSLERGSGHLSTASTKRGGGAYLWHRM